jgi:hypothetical protein
VALADLARAAKLERENIIRPVAYMADLRRLDLVNDEFVKAVSELRDLRNRVAHGAHNPTPGEAVAYAESAQVLVVVAHTKAYMLSNNP